MSEQQQPDPFSKTAPETPSSYPPPPPATGVYQPPPPPPAGFYPPPPIGAYPSYTGNNPPMTPRNGLGIAALVLGIISIVMFWFFGIGVALGITAVILGFLARRRVKKGEANNGGVALAGIITGVLGFIAGVVFIGFFVWVFKEAGISDLGNCLEKAGNNQSEIDKCENEFSDRVNTRFGVTITETP
ncbi:MAG: DUF4190 domain-containing protein [Mycobacteriaceae bacterium]